MSPISKVSGYLACCLINEDLYPYALEPYLYSILFMTVCERDWKTRGKDNTFASEVHAISDQGQSPNINSSVMKLSSP